MSKQDLKSLSNEELAFEVVEAATQRVGGEENFAKITRAFNFAPDWAVAAAVLRVTAAELEEVLASTTPSKAMGDLIMGKLVEFTLQAAGVPADDIRPRA